VHGIGSDDAAVERQQGEQFGQRHDLVGAVDPPLAEHQALLAGPGADQVQRRPAVLAVERAPRGLAVDRDHALDLRGQRAQSAREAGLDGVAIEPPEDPREGVVARHAARQPQEAAQQRLLAASEPGHVDATRSAAQLATSASIMISSRSWRCALPLRGSSSSAKHARKPSMPSSPALRRQDHKHLSTPKESTYSLCDSPGLAGEN
jgi:hypothetical protein